MGYLVGLFGAHPVRSEAVSRWQFPFSRENNGNFVRNGNFRNQQRAIAPLKSCDWTGNSRGAKTGIFRQPDGTYGPTFCA